MRVAFLSFTFPPLRPLTALCGPSYVALPAPADLGTKEFRWRCFLSAMTRRGWRTAILRSPCPRVTLQCPFALVSADFAQLTTSLGVPELALDRLPLVFPQVATSSLFLQLLGNSNFPASVRNLRIKALTICQLRPLDMRFHDATAAADNPSALHVRGSNNLASCDMLY